MTAKIPTSIVRDDGCMRFDPIPVTEEAFSETATMKNGKVYPLISFGPHQIPSATMAKYMTTRSDSEILVPNFSAIFAQEDKAKVYGMMFRFRPTYQALTNGKYTFARR